MNETLVKSNLAGILLDMLPLFAMSYFKFTFENKENVLSPLILFIYDLISRIVLLNKRIHKFLNLRFRPVFNTWQLLEKFYFVFDFFLFYLLKAFLVVAASDGGKATIR